MTEGRVDLTSVAIDASKYGVSRREFSDGVRREHVECFRGMLLGLREVAEALFGRPIGPPCVKKPPVSNRAQLSQGLCPADSIFFCAKVQAALIPPLCERKIPDSGQVFVSATQVKRAGSRTLRVL